MAVRTNTELKPREAAEEREINDLEDILSNANEHPETDFTGKEDQLYTLERDHTDISELDWTTLSNYTERDITEDVRRYFSPKRIPISVRDIEIGKDSHVFIIYAGPEENPRSFIFHYRSASHTNGVLVPYAAARELKEILFESAEQIFYGTDSLGNPRIGNHTYSHDLINDLHTYSSTFAFNVLGLRVDILIVNTLDPKKARSFEFEVRDCREMWRDDYMPRIHTFFKELFLDQI